MKTAWFGEPALKSRVMDLLREDRRLDRISQGVYWEGDRGCHLGCLTRAGADDSPHEATERMFGIPERIAHWLEAVFEGLPKDQCEWWVIAATEAIPVGADLSLSHHELAAWLLSDESPSAKGNQHELTRQAVAKVRELHLRAAAGDAVDDSEWSAAESACSAAAAAAWSAAAESAAAESACSAAAESACSAAAESACSAAAAAAESAAESAWKSIADKSIEIFAAAPVAECDECNSCIERTMLNLASPVTV